MFVKCCTWKGARSWRALSCSCRRAGGGRSGFGFPDCRTQRADGWAPPRGMLEALCGSLRRALARGPGLRPPASRGPCAPAAPRRPLSPPAAHWVPPPRPMASPPLAVTGLARQVPQRRAGGRGAAWTRSPGPRAALQPPPARPRGPAGRRPPPGDVSVAAEAALGRGESGIPRLPRVTAKSCAPRHPQNILTAAFCPRGSLSSLSPPYLFSISGPFFFKSIPFSNSSISLVCLGIFSFTP